VSAPSTDLKRAQRKLDAARLGRDSAICAASDLGLSLREIAAATGLGVETVRRILKAAT